MIRCEGFDLSVCAPSPRPYFQDGTPRDLFTHDHRTQELCECLTDEGCQCLMWATLKTRELAAVARALLDALDASNDAAPDVDHAPPNGQGTSRRT